MLLRKRMDLVASYDSEHGEDSDIEEMKTSQKKTCLGNKTIDIIDLDSDSDDGTTSQSDSNKMSSENPQHTSLNSTKNTVNCPDVNEKVIQPNHDPKTLADENNATTSDSTSKKPDYLNLETSDSDTDTEMVENKIDNLINAAAVLNDAPCGPAKPSEVPSQLSKRVIDSDINSNRSTPNSVVSSAAIVDDALSVSGDNKRLKTDVLAETVAFKTEAPKSEPDSCLLKEDKRIIKANKSTVLCTIPKLVVESHKAHSNFISALNWCIPRYSHLYLSGSLDGTVKIWDLFLKVPVQCVLVTGGASAAKWSLDGGQIYTGGAEKKAFVFDVQTGKKEAEYDVYNYINSMEVHPYMEDVFLCGTNNAVLAFDIRVNTKFPIRTFLSSCKEVLDIAFLDENEFVCSTNIVSHDSADRTIMVWDFGSGAILSNQIFLERYTCPSIKVHPNEPSFIAQTNGNYIVAFSSTRPYKMKNKRYMPHKVLGYAIECDISPDGKYIASGDAEGAVYIYNYATCVQASKNMVKQNCPTNKVKWHPAFSSTMISASYDGQIQIWK